MGCNIPHPLKTNDMSHGINCLHSHSGIERSVKNLAKDKFHVLVDEEYKDMFDSCGVKPIPFTYERVKYYLVPTRAFIDKGGVFKNFSK